jgi:hypothetical protein
MKKDYTAPTFTKYPPIESAANVVYYYYYY